MVSHTYWRASWCILYFLLRIRSRLRRLKKLSTTGLCEVPRAFLEHVIIQEDARLYGWDILLSDYGLSPLTLWAGPTHGDVSLYLDAAMKT
jgi:hypothetical protein